MRPVVAGLALLATLALAGCGAERTLVKELSPDDEGFLQVGIRTIKLYDGSTLGPVDEKLAPELALFTALLEHKGYRVERLGPTTAPRSEGGEVIEAAVNTRRRDWIAPDEALLVLSFSLDETGAPGATPEVRTSLWVSLFRYDEPSLMFRVYVAETDERAEWEDVIDAALEPVPLKRGG
jgi:hypothetical protein